MLHTLLHEFVDYAGLFPPAALPLSDVVANYAAYRNSSARWMLARLIVPRRQLEDFANETIPYRSEIDPWPISCLIPPPDADGFGFDADWSAIAAFNQQAASWARIDSVETKADAPEQIEKFVARCPAEIAVYWEIPHTRPMGEMLQTIAAAGPGHRAKIRTGGIQAALIAQTADVARFIRSCLEWGVAFKATAGLHHALRGDYALTYEPASPCATMHGFLNLFVASVLAQACGISAEEIAQILEANDLSKFRWNAEGVGWFDHWASAKEVHRARESFAIAFGSCSFLEPVEELQRLGLGLSSFDRPPQPSVGQN